MAGREGSRASSESQADGAAEDSGPTPSGTAAIEPEPAHPFSVDVAWSGAGGGGGTVRLPQGNVSIEIGGAKVLSGRGSGANPEELLLAALGACFVDTWSIFLEKLKVAYSRPALRVAGVVGKDPAGGYRVREVTIHARVPSTLLADSRAAVEKTLSLAEKYCIVSRALKPGVPIRVEIEEV